MTGKTLPAVLALIGGLTLAPTAPAATITPNSTADAFDGGGDCTLREAVDTANVNVSQRGCVGVGAFGDFDTIVLSDSTGYVLTIPVQPGSPDDDTDGDLDVDPVADNTTVTITATVPTFIDGGGIDRVFDVRPNSILNLQNVTIRNGTAGSGGAIRAGINTGMELTGVTVSGNTANLSVGGGIETQGEITLLNSTVSGNRAVTDGGGIEVSAGELELNSSTVSANTADFDGDDLGDGGGVAVNAAVSVELKDTVLSGNADGSTPADAPECSGPAASLGTNLIGSLSGCGIVLAPGDRTGAPQLGGLAANGGFTATHALLAGSPAIDAGSGTCPATDQRGTARPQATRCDIGAYELIAGPPTAPLRCGGKLVTIPGTNRRDVITGTNGPDVITGLKGRDRIRGAGGNDTICGGQGGDLLRGSRGKDRLIGGGGRDRLIGGGAPDVCRGGAGRDRERSC